MEQNDKQNKKSWESSYDYENFVFEKVMQLYCEKQSREILSELESENADSSDLDLDFINRLIDRARS